MRKIRLVVFVITLCNYSSAEDRISVHVLGLFHPNQLMVSSGTDRLVLARAGGQTLSVGDSLCTNAILSRTGSEVSIRCGELRLKAPQIIFSSESAEAEFLLAVPGKLRRKYRGELTVVSNNKELIPTIEMDLETATASVVASELPEETPFEALKAQAVVARSFLKASGRRHLEADFCDTTHCQFLRSPPPASSVAARATAATKGMFLTWNGKPFPAMYSASCGGHTRTLAEAGYRQPDYPYFAVECAYCLRRQETDRSSGHRIGLCQRGAVGMARDGTDFRRILLHYFPNTEVREADSVMTVGGSF